MANRTRIKRKRKIILVRGVGNSGKTESIRRYAEMEGVFLPTDHYPWDIRIVFPLRRRPLIMGVASGGDNVRILQTNFRFFKSHKWDVIVCASKANGDTVAYVQRQALAFGASLSYVRTKKVPPRFRKNENDQRAREILKLVR